MNKRIVAVAVGLVLALVVGPLRAQARYLNPNTGRFQTMDSYEGNSQDPQSLHKYLYAQGNPANRIDPSGLDSVVLITDNTSTGDVLWWRLSPWYWNIYYPMKSIDEMIVTLQTHVDSSKELIDHLHLSGHGYGAGVSFKNGGFHAWRLSDDQTYRMRRLFASNATLTLWGCQAGNHMPEMQLLADKLGVSVSGKDENVSAGPDISLESDMLADYFTEVFTGEKQQPHWKTTEPSNKPRLKVLSPQISNISHNYIFKITMPLY